MDNDATVEGKRIEIDPEASCLIPKEVALDLRVLPLRVDENGLHVLASSKSSPSLESDLAFLTGKNVVVKYADEDLVLSSIRKLYGEMNILDTSQRDLTNEVSLANGRSEDETTSEIGSAGLAISTSSAVEAVNQIITQAINSGASDIHVEPYEHVLRVRYRLDGVLHETYCGPLDLAKALISRLKIMADLDIAEKRRPQDGRIRVKEGERTIDIRVSSLPTDFGEKIVLRILDKSHLRLDLSALGFQGDDLALFEKTIRLPYGMILVTGPTGSGKTTTLYAALNSINKPELNITTIEDPIEYNLVGINQTQVRSDIDLTFAAVLRSILRQDPNVIMVGEIRDGETAQIAIRSALTGHLVFSTLHTNDAPSALTRLVDMGVESFLVASSVKMILAQRLLRKICSDCAVDYAPTKTEQEELGLQGDSATGFLKGAGCPMCHQTGYRGRTAIYEVLVVENEVSDLIAKGAFASEIRAKAKENGSRTLRDAAILAAKQGTTTVEEVLRETVA